MTEGESKISEWVGEVHEGDAYEVLDDMPSNSVNMAMTSPPYYGLRDYNVDEQIGHEESLVEYIDNIVEIGNEVQRVLRDEGSWWLNLGDGYRKNKRKMLIPHKVAIALQSSGWIVRNDVVWKKTNPMPESVKDRLSNTFEFLFHLTPSTEYYYDLDSIREPYAESSIKRVNQNNGNPKFNGNRSRGHPQGGKETLNPDQFVRDDGKNPGDVIELSTASYDDDHFAVYPEELCEKPIKSTAPEEVCEGCGVPCSPNYTCDCDTDATKPGVVLDPFAGSGTTCVAAENLGRRWVGIDLNPDYVEMSETRVVEETEYAYESARSW